MNRSFFFLRILAFFRNISFSCIRETDESFLYPESRYSVTKNNLFRYQRRYQKGGNMKKRSIIGSAFRAAGRFTRGVVAVGTVGVSELAIAGVKKVGSIFKEKKSDEDPDEIDFEEIEDAFEEALEDAVEANFREVDDTPTAAEMAEVAENWEAKATSEATPAPQAAVASAQ